MPRFVCVVLCLLCLASVAAGQGSRTDSAKAYIERGNGWFKKGEVERAIGDYDLAIATDPHLATAYHNRGFARRRQGNPDGARSDYN
ncbi:MAG: tetratricopeptide repeat protein, partial [Acidobacteriota bacterium]|nr:tetratricopeptide repeat protein [Acidobacteriota bacterium]